MIDELHVRDLALISDVSIEPAAGLTVLTGETGAGKSALLSAIKLLLGERASGDQVRDGSAGLMVEGRLVRADEAAECPDGHVVCRRVSAEGRSRVSVDGSMATVAQLGKVVGETIDLCGQHDHQRLLNPANHLGLLDSWAASEVAQAKAAYRAAWQARRDAQAELDRVEAAASETGARVEEARFAIARIEEVAPRPGEYEELEALLPRLEHAESLAAASNAAYEAVQGEGGALDALNVALDELERAGRVDPELQRIADALREAVFPAEDVAADLRRYRDDVDFDPGALAQADARMGELVGLTRTFGPRMEDVFARLEESRELVGLVDDSEAALARARSAVEAAERDLVEAAGVLSERRAAAAPRFASQVSTQMARLEMGGAELIVQVAPLARAQWSATGADRVEFLYRAGAALTPRPFVKIASGGEVSRVMLALKVALGENDDVETLIFDEVDAGVGGSTGRAIAAVLADLARTHQVIVVTHLAQVAVAAERHYVVSKGAGENGRPETRIEAVEGEARVREVARMLSGDLGASSLEHARDLVHDGELLRADCPRARAA
jgi:DNA repair protein RecN (Recombination protein N)